MSQESLPADVREALDSYALAIDKRRAVRCETAEVPDSLPWQEVTDPQELARIAAEGACDGARAAVERAIRRAIDSANRG